MANTITRLTANGNYYIAGQFDEVTFNTNSGYSKNLLKNSNFYSGWNLGGGATFIANNAIAPDGTQTAGKLSFLTVGSEYIYQNMTWTANKYYTISIYVKPIAETFIQIESFQQYGYATFQLTGNGSLYSTYQSSVLITNTSISFDPKTGYYRCSATFFASANGSNNIGFTNGGSALTADAYYIWGAQAEIGTSLTIYQPTDANGNIASQNSITKLENSGNFYVTGNYDEYTKGQNLVTNGLIYYMDPSKPESWNGSGTVINDITKTNPSGTLVGGYTYNYQNGGVIQFDGLTGYANTNILGNTAQFQTNSTYTLSIWAKLTGNSATTSGSAGTWQTTIFGSLDYAGYGIYGYEYGGSNILQQVQAGIRCSGVNVSSTSQNLTLGVWYNFVMTYNGTGSGTQGLNFYVNGASVYSNATVATGQLNLGSTDVISMGKNLPQSNAPAGTWPGQIGQALIYNRALSSAEVSQNFQEMRSQYGV